MSIETEITASQVVVVAELWETDAN